MGLGFGLGFVRARLDAVQLDEVIDEADLVRVRVRVGVRVRARSRR